MSQEAKIPETGTLEDLALYYSEQQDLRKKAKKELSSIQGRVGSIDTVDFSALDSEEALSITFDGSNPSMEVLQFMASQCLDFVSDSAPHPDLRGQTSIHLTNEAGDGILSAPKNLIIPDEVKERISSEEYWELFIAILPYAVSKIYLPPRMTTEALDTMKGNLVEKYEEESPEPSEFTIKKIRKVLDKLEFPEENVQAIILGQLGDEYLDLAHKLLSIDSPDVMDDDRIVRTLSQIGPGGIQFSEQELDLFEKASARIFEGLIGYTVAEFLDGSSSQEILTSITQERESALTKFQGDLATAQENYSYVVYTLNESVLELISFKEAIGFLADWKTKESVEHTTLIEKIQADLLTTLLISPQDFEGFINYISDIRSTRIGAMDQELEKREAHIPKLEALVKEPVLAITGSTKTRGGRHSIWETSPEARGRAIQKLKDTRTELTSLAAEIQELQSRLDSQPTQEEADMFIEQKIMAFFE
ncbi:MAG TPA: hypothetical protein ENI23_03375 [bacterium]|nr:hypothetical protein [bacterium]